MAVVRFRLRRDTAARWTSVDPVLGPGEPALETDTKRVKYGDGVTAWSALPYPINPINWGSITGTLADQTDLKNALDAKANSSSLGSMASKNTGVSGTFTTADSKTVTVVDGIITSIV